MPGFLLWDYLTILIGYHIISLKDLSVCCKAGLSRLMKQL